MAPSFPATVSLVEIDDKQLQSHVSVIREVFRNMCGILFTTNVEDLMRATVPPKNIRLDVLSFHWDEVYGCGYYIPFDVVPAIKLLYTVRNLAYEKHGMVLLHSLRSAVERRYVQYLSGFGGPFAFTVPYNPPVHACPAGRVTPSRIAVPNHYRAADAAGLTDRLFVEFKEAIRVRLYEDLQWNGVSFCMSNFLHQACAPPPPPPQVAPPPPPEAASPSRSVTPLVENSPLSVDPAHYSTMQYSTVMFLQDSAVPARVALDLRIHYPDTDAPAAEARGVLVSSFHDLENYMRTVACRGRFWAEVVVVGEGGVKMNHVTFESAMRVPEASFDVFMHRFVDIPTLVSISVLGPDGGVVRSGRGCLTHRTFDSLESQGRAMATARFSMPDLMDRDAYLLEVGDTLTGGSRIAVTPRTYGEYLRLHDTLLGLVFYRPGVNVDLDAYSPRTPTP